MHSSAVPYSNPVTEHTIMSILQKSTLKLERFIGVFKFAQLTQRFNSGPLTPEAYIFACNTTSSLWWPVSISIMSNQAMWTEELNITEGPAMPGRG